MFDLSRWPAGKALQNNLLWVTGRYVGGGAAANLTKVAGGRGITSVATRSSTGKYRINFSHVPAGSFLGCWFCVGNDADTAADSKVASYVEGSYSSANKTLDFTVVDLGATPALADLATTEGLSVLVLFAETAQP